MSKDGLGVERLLRKWCDKYMLKGMVAKMSGVSVDYLTEIREGLYQSPTVVFLLDNVEEDGIKVVFDLSGGFDRKDLAKLVELYVYCPLQDTGVLPDLKMLDALATLGARMVKEGKKVLTHCTMGFNRSGLLNGLILVKLGLTGKESVQLIQSKIPMALHNKVFREYLESL